MIRFGFHISIAQGFARVTARALERQCQTVQIFSRNPRGWKYNALNREDCAVFVKDLAQASIAPVFVHMPYLPNLAIPESKFHDRAADSLQEELRRAEIIGAGYVIMHAGSSVDLKAGIRQMISGINRVLETVRNKVAVLIENTAGRGNEIGHRFEHLAEITGGIKDRSRIGITLDTAHAFQAGYDLRSKNAVDRTLKEFDRVIGFEMLELVHFNDSRTALGSRHDRHWHIGKGEIGKGMGYIANHPGLNGKPFIMETPRMTLSDDLMNMAAAGKFVNRRAKP
ncbi:MAG TPA: deoxyribonuclease IV [bacterium]